MNSSQIFGTCRERYRRKVNPEAINENLSFPGVQGNFDNPSDGSPWMWWNTGRTEYLRLEGGSNEWRLVATAGMAHSTRRNPANGSSSAKMYLNHNHENQTGELYLRLMFVSLVTPGNMTHPIFSIIDKDSGLLDLSVEGKLEGQGADAKCTFIVTYRDANGDPFTYQTEKLPLYTTAYHNYFDMRIFIPAPESGDVARIVLREFRGLTTEVEYKMTGTEGKGFYDKPGPKQIAWMSTVDGAKQGVAGINPMRLGIGNLIKYALP